MQQLSPSNVEVDPSKLNDDRSPQKLSSKEELEADTNASPWPAIPEEEKENSFNKCCNHKLFAS
jgi:hypothetical protein